LHPRVGFWGGAPATARQWYDKTVATLAARSWPDAVHAAGILSHYVTDAVHPFHTGQSEAENSIHRAFEWSTAKSYDALKAAAGGKAPAEIAVPGRPDWLEEMLRAGAVRANAHYEKLIAHYDINRGVVDPPAGLDTVAQRIVGDLILYASRLYGVILGRALEEAQVTPPEVSLTVDTVLATLQMPIKALSKRLADKADREQVERMYDELRSTGTVEVNLPEDDRAVRELHRAEVGGLTPALMAARPVPRIEPLAELPAFITLAQRLAEGAPSAAEPAKAARKDAKSAAPTSPQVQTITKGSVPSIKARATASQAARPRLAPSDAVVEAPSIGPRMAERLQPLSVITVQDLLDADPAAIAKSLSASYVTASTVTDWQAQARLVCTVPGLSGTGAQLFVGAGYRDVGAIAAAEPDKLSADLLAFAATADGRRILRDGEPPNVERIKNWAEGARMAIAA
jgi:predicted flap endonuclease-1-like 5' DNA nuclease